MSDSSTIPAIIQIDRCSFCVAKAQVQVGAAGVTSSKVVVCSIISSTLNCFYNLCFDMLNHHSYHSYITSYDYSADRSSAVGHHQD